MSATAFSLLGFDLFGEPVRPEGSGPLASRFVFPPFSVLNAREGEWQERKRAWLALGIKSELGRGAEAGKNLTMSATIQREVPGADQALKHSQAATALSQKLAPGGGGGGAWLGGPKTASSEEFGNGRRLGVTFGPEGNIAGEQAGTSIFDPVLAELCYRWFCPPGGQVVDPFAGGSVRGIVAGLLGFKYHGIDLSAGQLEANRAQARAIAPGADIVWAHGDSLAELANAPPADFVFSCPPYGDLERYSDDPRDLSTMTYSQFIYSLGDVVDAIVRNLKPDRMACFVVGDFRDKKTGMYRGFPADVCHLFQLAGMPLYNEAILVTAVGSLPIRVSGQFPKGRKLGKTHQNVLVFAKGDPTRAPWGAEP